MEEAFGRWSTGQQSLSLGETFLSTETKCGRCVSPLLMFPLSTSDTAWRERCDREGLHAERSVSFLAVRIPHGILHVPSLSGNARFAFRQIPILLQVCDEDREFPKLPYDRVTQRSPRAFNPENLKLASIYG